MASVFTDVAKQVAYGNSLKVQRYHGGLSDTLTSGVTLTNIGTNNQVIYLCAIPVYARIKSISITFDAAANYADTSPLGSLFIRSMKNKTAKTSTDLASLDYEKILGTTNDYSSASGNALLTGASLSNDNTHEVPLATGISLNPTGTTAAVSGVNYEVALPYGLRQYTIAEALCYTKSVSWGDSTVNKTTFCDNAKDLISKEHFGMLTYVCTTEGKSTSSSTDVSTEGNALISVTYIDPAPSSTANGTIIRNSSSTIV